MRRLLLGVVVFLVIGIALSLVFHEHQGYVLISFNGWQIETSVLFAVAGVLLGVWLLALAWQLLVAILFAPRTLRRLRNRRQRTKARHAWQTGLVHLAEARWSTAEKELEAKAEANESPGLNHLFAARAAHYRDDVSARDAYLQKASASRSISELAVLMTQAELQIAAGEDVEASATLSRLHELEPKHPWVLRLYAEHALATGDYGVLYGLLPELKRADSLSSERLSVMTIAAYRHHLSQPADVGALTSAWRDVPKDLRARPEIVEHYARALSQMGEDDEAANVIRATLKKHYDGQLVRTFGRLNPRDESGQLASVQDWISQHGREPELMLAAGRLFLARQQLDEARDYLTSEYASQLGATGLLDLGRLLERLQEAERARLVYRRGLETVTYGA
ncbi:heme biosynthesis HemY N-terminal domain-containing protein [Salinisphaera sp. Q1T1-3]|uniref:heme biosynthesis HemY N-terminal domain-containing protein n=1 Tax=Salinisphaera sp. Q1T1-3 TaxID=2321229 RepID=UPI000E772C3B|nr:heme biosynthesis HemY N-terminal domain-containing protein [Salinisphaera sp. Q1T1-3]RJS91390.1 hypothetical protein D3260_15405 [Salinisphaera sp. Q1T1-3]